VGYLNDVMTLFYKNFSWRHDNAVTKDNSNADCAEGSRNPGRNDSLRRALPARVLHLHSDAAKCPLVWPNGAFCKELVNIIKDDEIETTKRQFVG